MKLYVIWQQGGPDFECSVRQALTPRKHSQLRVLGGLNAAVLGGLNAGSYIVETRWRWQTGDRDFNWATFGVRWK
jgi:hypothetical protein